MFREPGHSASSMTSLPPYCPTCRAVDLSSCQFRRAASFDQVRAWMFREPGHSASSMTSFAAGLPNLPSCRAAIPPGRKCWPSQGVDVSRAGPQRIFHDFLCRRAGHPAELSSCRAVEHQLCRAADACL